jgi:hypothetical protein
MDNSVVPGTMITGLDKNHWFRKVITDNLTDTTFGPVTERMWGRPTISTSSAATPFTVAHEFGHAKNLNSLRKLLGAKGTTVAYMLSRAPAILGGAGLGAAMAVNPDKDVRKYAPLVALAGTAPTFADEALASFRGVRSLHRNIPRLARKSNYLRAALQPLVGYTPLVIPAAGVYLAKSLADRMYANSKKTDG